MAEEYNLRDVFGNLVPFDKASIAARSNLSSQYTNDEVNKMLGSATGQQIGDWAKGSNLDIAGGFGAGAGALPSATTLNQPLFATSDQEAEAKRLQEARNAGYEAQASNQRYEAGQLQAKEAGGLTAMGAKGGKAGVGFDSIVADQIEQTKKTLAKNLVDIDAALNAAKLNNDTATFDKISKIRKEASDAYYQALSASIQQKQLEIQQLTADRTYGLDLAKMNMSQNQFDEQMALNTSQFEENKNQFGLTQAMEKWKTTISQTESAADREISFQTLLNNTPLGQTVNINLPDGTVKSGVGRFQYASKDGGAGEGQFKLSADDSQYMPLLTTLDANGKDTGIYQVNPNAIDLYISQKGGDRLTAANKANALADKLNAAKKAQTEEQNKPKIDITQTFTNSFGKGNFSKISLTDRANELRKITDNESSMNILNRQQLIKEGYNPNEVKQVMPLGGVSGFFENVGETVTGVGSFFSNLFGD